ncbi:hypothetical protein LR68_03701 [Anoxybacillus sp. BCO1]|nr:hypothetical protein LR68_03701 [Anoxybacillus sp. BCO1]
MKKWFVVVSSFERLFVEIVNKIVNFLIVMTKDLFIMLKYVYIRFGGEHMLHIVACIKQVPDTKIIKMNPKTNTMDRASALLF